MAPITQSMFPRGYASKGGNNPATMSSPDIVVVGSSNMDLITYVDRLPKLGETIHGKACT